MTSESPPQHAQRGHHPFSPSTLNSRFHSPCWIPAGGTSEAAERGTAQHQAVESRSDEGLDDHEAYAVASAIALVDNHLNAIQQHGFAHYILSEQYLPIDEVSMEGADGSRWQGTTGGYADSVILWQTEDGNWNVAIRDWKFGKYAVTPAHKNLQGWAYVLGAAEHLRKLNGGILHKASVTFYSPHREEHGDSINTAEFDSDFIYGEMLASVKAVVARAKQCLADIEATPDNVTLYRPVANNCMFCGRLGRCPAVAQTMLQLGHQYAPLELPDDIRGWNTTDPSQLALGLKVADLAKRWADAWRKGHTERCLENPALVPEGYTLVATTPTKVVDRKGLNRYLIEHFGAEKVAENTDIALTPFLKLVRAEAPRGEKDNAEEAFRLDLESKGLTRPSDVPVLSLRMK